MNEQHFQFPEDPSERRSSGPSCGSWLFTAVMLCIPIVDLIYLVCLALGKTKHPEKVNYAKAMLLWTLIWFVVCFLFGFQLIVFASMLS